ncbi:hypothetical protein LL912_24280 [Niabella sp. CC-SYL272]|uniref:hypothetical protein n=1 Tax=Niabella agricola TaxID=2891571 RepID=UPI001F2773BA|nr:hypothetical protein [Niabella agricola]MCF3111928.1 hypothetical protein [Niabella agricola]
MADPTIQKAYELFVDSLSIDSIATRSSWLRAVIAARYGPAPEAQSLKLAIRQPVLVSCTT